MRRLYDDDDAVAYGYCADCKTQDGTHLHGCPSDPLGSEYDQEPGEGFDFVAFADHENAKAGTLSLYPPAYPTETARRLYDAHVREEILSRAARCDAPRCSWCGGPLTNHDTRCLEMQP